MLIATSQLRPLSTDEADFSINTQEQYLVATGSVILYKGSDVSRNFKSCQIVNINQLLFLSNNKMIGELNERLREALDPIVTSGPAHENHQPEEDKTTMQSAQELFMETWSIQPVGLATLIKLDSTIVHEGSHLLTSDTECRPY